MDDQAPFSPPEDESESLATQPDQTRPARLPRLSHEQIFFLIDLYARGYTVRAIQARLADQYDLHLSHMQILQGAVLYADDVERYRQEVDEITISRGLARKEERIRRLTEVAEAWEQRAIGPDASPRTAQIYLRALAQIQSEVEPLGLHVHINKEDPWVQILSNLQRKDSTYLLPKAQPLDPEQTTTDPPSNPSD